jgi:hypothetical protein
MVRDFVHAAYPLGKPAHPEIVLMVEDGPHAQFACKAF